MKRVLGVCVVWWWLAVAKGEWEARAYLKLNNLEAFEAKFWRLNTPGSEEYMRWLRVEEIGEMIGPEEATVRAAEAWLREAGAREVRVSGLGDHVRATFSTDDVEEAGAAAALAKKKTEALRRTAPEGVEFVAGRRIDMIVRRPVSSGARSSPYTVSAIKEAYGIPENETASSLATQMVWGPGTFGYSHAELLEFKKTQVPLLNMSRITYDTSNRGTRGGDNFAEGTLDVEMTAAFGLGVRTIVSNTNTSSTTEEGDGFGDALLEFLTDLAGRDEVPDVLSMSLGSLAADSCDLLCKGASSLGKNVSDAECRAYLQTQRQVCMFLSTTQTSKINVALQALGARGVSVFAASGDGGSHFSFQAFDESGADADIAAVLNEVSCALQLPVFPTSSPYLTAVGGTQWANDDPSRPVVWGTSTYGSGAGFSRQFAAPDHQKTAVAAYLAGVQALPPADSFDPNGRAYPDLAAVGVDGTSMSCPIVAGIFSLLIDRRLQSGLPRLGLITPRLYAIYDDDGRDVLQDGAPFDDVPSGASNTSCDNGFLAYPGHWDVLSGWGQPNWANLLAYFATDDLVEEVAQQQLRIRRDSSSPPQPPPSAAAAAASSSS